MPNTLVSSKWDSGSLIFHDANDYGASAEIFKIAQGALTIGTSTSAVTLTMSAAPINFSGTFTSDCIDFSSTVIDHTGSNGPCLIRAGTYANPISNADEDQSGFIRLYGETSANGTSYDRGIFVTLKTTGLKGIFPISALAEIKAQGGAGPNKAQAAQFIVALQDATSRLATLGGDGTAGMYGAWMKVSSHGSSTASAGSRVAPIWLDNQMIGTVSGEEYAAFITTGGSAPDAVFGFETTSGGWTQFLYFDETCSSTVPVVTSGLNVSGAGSSEAYLKVLLNATQYGIPLIAV